MNLRKAGLLLLLSAAVVSCEAEVQPGTLAVLPPLRQRREDIRELSRFYLEQAANERFLPYIVETSAGADRVTLTLLVDAYRDPAFCRDVRPVAYVPEAQRVTDLVVDDHLPVGVEQRPSAVAGSREAPADIGAPG